MLKKCTPAFSGCFSCVVYVVLDCSVFLPWLKTRLMGSRWSPRSRAYATKQQQCTHNMLLFLLFKFCLASLCFVCLFVCSFNRTSMHERRLLTLTQDLFVYTGTNPQTRAQMRSNETKVVTVLIGWVIIWCFCSGFCLVTVFVSFRVANRFSVP